jgi:hypothetical protein
MEIQNNTPHPAVWLPCVGLRGHESVLLIAKATFAFDGSGQLTVAREQLPIQQQDSYRGEPGKTSTQWEADVALGKEGADVILLGHARPSPRSPEQVDVAVRVGNVQKTVRVFGDRRWESSVSGFRISKPLPFEKVPLIYERAFGGADASSSEPAAYPANPVGAGFRKDPNKMDGVALPNLEDPQALLSRPSDRPRPAGFGFYGRGWSPRWQLAGTYDQKWREKRCPLLPEDFKVRHFNAAHPDLILPQPLQGGESVVIENASPVSPLRLQVPRLPLTFRVGLGREVHSLQPALDTMVIDTDRSLVVLLARALFPCHRQVLRLRGFRLDPGEARR